MTLRAKIVLVICIFSALSIAALFLVQNIILTTRFAKLERQQTGDNLGRALNAVQQDISSVSTTVGDWAPWDDTYIFVQDNNTEYIVNNLSDETVANLGMNLILIVRNDGDLAYAKALDLKTQTEVAPPPSVPRILSPDGPLPQMSDEESSVSGIMSLPEGPLVVAAQPILTSLGEGPIQGTLIMGRYLDAVEVQRLADLTHLSVSVYSLEGSDMPSDVQSAQSALSVEQPSTVHPLSKDSIAGYSLITDIHGNPALVLKIDQPRDIYKQGQETIGYVILTLVVLFIWSGSASVILIDRFLLLRLNRLAADVDKAGASGNRAGRVPDEGDDEFARVAQAINRTLSSLDQAQSDLKASEARNRALITALPDLIIRMDRNGIPLDKGAAKANAAAQAVPEDAFRWPQKAREATGFSPFRSFTRTCTGQTTRPRSTSRHTCVTW